ncbi:YihY/virulence factor BrkB family protein [Clostridium oceanicum]|uniref:YihY/virulence factor BrkB family protein n=1 Tax=Clostridium oceanicum TaxID=1543 RepID=A0ABN1JB07_9CLOT
MIEDIKNLVQRFLDDEVLALSSQLAYSLIISVFPFLIFLITLVGFLPIKADDLYLGLREILPKETYLLIYSTVTDIINSQNSDILSLSIFITIWAATAGFRAVIRGLNKAYDIEENRSFIKVQIMTLISTIALAIILIMTIFLLVFGRVIGKTVVAKLGLAYEFNNIWNIIRYVIMVSIAILIFALVYYYTPSIRLRWRDVLPGALFSTVAWIVVSLGFSFYVDNFNNYSRLYGSIGAVIVFLVWLYLTSIIIITGGEINAMRAFKREGKEKPRRKNYL